MKYALSKKIIVSSKRKEILALVFGKREIFFSKKVLVFGDSERMWPTMDWFKLRDWDSSNFNSLREVRVYNY